MKLVAKKMVFVGLLVGALCAGLSAAPKKKAKKSSSSGKFADVAPKTDASGKVYNFGGLKVRVADWWTFSEQPVLSQSDQDTRDWRKWGEETYNYSVTEKSLASGYDDHPEALARICTTGTKENLVIVIDGRSSLLGVKQNFYYDLSKVKNIDWDAEKWDQGARNFLKKGNSFYAMRHLPPEPRGGVFFNKRILAECGIDPDEPYNLQAQGKWTWETFENLLKKTTLDLDNDGIIDVYGMANSSTEFAPLAAMSNGSTFIGRDANGKLYNNAGSEATLESLAWCAHLATNYEKPQPEGSNWDWMYASFINGEVAFQADQEYQVARYAGMVDDWGFVCFPLGPKGDGKYKTLHNDNLYVIPNVYSDKRAQEIAKVFDLYTEPTPGYNNPDDWKEGYYARFRDSRAVDETLQLMKDVPNPRYDTAVPGINYMGDMIWSVYPGYVTPQQAYEESKNHWQSLLDQIN